MLVERLVHGPLTALMLLESIAFHRPDVVMRHFAYRAVNPVIVSRPCIICGHWESRDVVRLWTIDDGGVVGMIGKVLVDN